LNDCKKATDYHERTAKMLAYLSALFPDTSWPFWPHFWLLTVSVLASFAVGAGIILESTEYSAAVHRVAKWLVISGVVVEAACTVTLFVFDEKISGAQQSRIESLDIESNELRRQNAALLKELAAAEHALADRWIWPNQQGPIIEKLSKFKGMTAHVGVYSSTAPDTFVFGTMLGGGILKAAGWIPIIWEVRGGWALPGMMVAYRADVPNAKEAAEALADAFRPIVGMASVSEMKADDPVWVPTEGKLVLTDPNVTLTKDTEAIRVFVGGKVNPFR
jgi:hypothetical protein